MTTGLNRTDCIRELVAQRLKSVAASELSSVPAGSHIDEDTIAAFVEGRLTDTECKPILSHLAACGLCRRASAQLVQLENQIDEEVSTAGDEEPGRLEALLSRLRAVVPSAGEEVVFAYEHPPTEAEGEKPAPEQSAPADEQ